MKRRKTFIYDLCLCLGLLLLAGAVFGILTLLRTPGAYAVVEVDGAFYGAYPLNEEAAVRIEGANGGCNLLVIAKGSAEIVEASCPDKLCVHQHAVAHTDETIICLPNRVVISVSEEGALP